MLPNKAEFTKLDLLALFGNKSLINIPDGWHCIGVSTDTREIINDNAFVALRGENSDGHARVAEAFSKGASAVFVEKTWYEENKSRFSSSPFVVVDNTLHALGKLGNEHRRRFNLPIIAIGGSNGKTTTKNLTAHVLSQKYKVLKTEANYNNQLGVPLMLLQLNSDYDIAVLEMGTNEPGEISILTNYVEPTHGLITNIGKEHLEKLIDLDGVELEETYLFGFLLKRNGTAFINMDDVRLEKYIKLLDEKVLFGTTENANIRGVIELDNKLHPKIDIDYNDRHIEANMKTFGYTCGLNAIAAASVGFHFDFNNEEIKIGLESFVQDTGHGYARMLVENIKGLEIINDCYNANPDSMTAALNTLKNIKTSSPKIAILGDMRELGEASFNEHCNILEIANESAENIYITGSEMKKAFEAISDKVKIKYFPDKDELLDFILKHLHKEDIVLVKGSRGMEMEKIIIGLKEKF
ncbi:MAG: UDP-N-acetylmuramoyl-tripeptide--D-alanyl-D-alanine ligase [FCB group bacterium]|jgi:UDP-N-acetylmuramoyl-tripeptide--D-alanyl-D-alanine ligase